MNIEKLRKYDLHQAKVGDQVVCVSLGKGEVVCVGHHQAVLQWEDTLYIFNVEEDHPLYLRPLAWLGDEPVYRGDVIYSKFTPEFVADQLSCGRLYSVSGSYMTMEGDKLQSPELFYLTPAIKTIVVNGFEVLAPITCPPEMGADYYVVDIMDKEYYRLWTWCDHFIDKLALERDLIHPTKEAAVAHAKAILGIDPESGRL